MKKLLTGFAIAGLLAVTGCNTSPTGGGTGGRGAGGAGGGSPSAGTFKMTAPSMSTDVKQGETKDVEVSMDKKSDFKEAIHFRTEVAPAGKGVTAEPEKKTLASGDADKKLMVKVHAEDKAAPGDYTVSLIGQPEKGNPTEVNFKVTVKAKGK
jgi:hypothetical protein